MVNRQNSFFGFIVAGAIALLLIAIAGFWFSTKSPVNLVASTSQPGAAIFVSKLSPVMVSLLTNPDRLQALEREGEISKIKTSLLAKSGIDYQKDVQPWLGNEITLAVTTTDIDRDSSNGKQPGYLMAVATNKQEKSREFIDLLFSKRVLAGGKLDVEEYQGVKVLYDSQLSAAVVGDGFVLFANNPSVVKDAINNVQAPDLNLTSSPQYQKATQQLPQVSLGVAFLNLPIIAQWQGLELPEPIYDSEIISLGLNSKGLLAETSFLTALELTPPSSPLIKPVGALKYIPASAGLAISGADLSNLGDSDLAKLWTQIKTAISGSGTDVISRLVAPLTQVQKTWGINFAQDIFSWVKGEYAIALLPRAEQTLPDWVFVVERTEGVPEAIANLDAIASKSGLSSSNLNLDQQKISAWTQLTAKQTQAKDRPSFAIEAKAQGIHTTLDNYEVFTSDLATMNEVLISKEKSLINDRNFQNSVAAIPQPNQGYLYLDWAKSQGILERQLPVLKLIEVLGKPFFNNLRSLTVSSYASEINALKGGVFLQLQE
ncbi:DUF3352 domain-containing protein [Nostoc sp. FACHB-152]|uniref:DUF3352 domain-containing protein n=1 Tax=unclassified Nostoc TaxID=2593658 RepID=UPI0016875C94|nr:MULTISPECIES: DUF3352 domain-containing protein [unclassified Nostoc]MBD2447585.1 DUF3352 domain-containing protein [Nostoc sp. FACHB-152]MBD2469357.1 DUF3352 domain-containing protein [Nostoc sp. FACHB-145]